MNRPLQPRLILFDVDGTLVDSQHLIHAAATETLRRLAVPAPERTFILAGVGLSLPEAMRRLIGEAASEAEVERAVEVYRDVFHELRADPLLAEPAFPDALAVLADLAASDHTLLGIVTGKSRRGIGHLMDRFGWHGLFATIQTADDAPSKPHPSMVLQAGREAGIDPDRTVVVGDTSFDMRMAKAAGAGAIGVSWGNHPVDELEKAGADLVLDAFLDLPAAADRLLRVAA